MMISRCAAGLAAAACLLVLAAGCGANSGTPGTGSSHTPAATATAAPSALASTPAGTPTTSAPVKTSAPVTTAPGSQVPVPRCQTSQLTAAYTGLNAAIGGSRGMTLILTNRSGSTCYVYGYPGLAFLNAGGFSMAT